MKQSEPSAALALRRATICDQIKEALAHMEASFEQVRRQWYATLGERFIQLRKTFESGRKGDYAFAAECRKQFPKISDISRREYTQYRRKLKTSDVATSDLPPLQKSKRKKPAARRKPPAPIYEKIRRVVAEEIPSAEQERFESHRQERETESDLVHALAEKIIAVGFRTLSVTMHPDKNGGSDDAQRRLNAARKLLLDALQSPIALIGGAH